MIGARPQFIKAAPVSRAFERSGRIEEIVVHTGQHFDDQMSSVFFREMMLPTPRHSLGINRLTHGAMTGRMLEAIEEVLIAESPDALLVYGDTNSTLAGALAACKLGVPVAHVEAGLRSHNLRMPEEYNRILTDRISSLLFAPTETAERNLREEGYDKFECRVVRTGDVMLDATLLFRSRDDLVSEPVKRRVDGPGYALLTLHRQENTDDPEVLTSLVETLNDLHGRHPIVCPIHPRTRGRLADSGLEPRFELMDPVGYVDMLHLVGGADIVLTDSGGLQKEAFFLGKYCLTLRTETEWVELVEAGVNRICGADPRAIRDAFDAWVGRDILDPPKLFGDGHASDLIAAVLAG